MSYDRAAALPVYALDFTARYPGLIVRARKPSWDATVRLARYVTALGSNPNGAILVDALDELVVAFADSVVSWTLVGVPVGRAGVLGLDPPFVLELARTWHAQVVMRPAVEPEPEVEPVEEGRSDVDDLLADAPMLALVDEPAADDGDIPSNEITGNVTSNASSQVEGVVAG